MQSRTVLALLLLLLLLGGVIAGTIVGYAFARVFPATQGDPHL